MIWNQCRELKNKLDGILEDVQSKMEKAHKEVRYTTVQGVEGAIRENLVNHFNHCTDKAE